MTALVILQLTAFVALVLVLALPLLFVVVPKVWEVLKNIVLWFIWVIWFREKK